jgi:hypothetical protein
MDAIIAPLSGSTALPAIDVFHALLAGNGRLTGPRTAAFVTAAAVVAALVAVADVVLAAAEGLGVGVEGDDDAVGVDEDSAARLACASAAWVAACVQPPASRASATRVTVSTYSWGRRTSAG